MKNNKSFWVCVVVVAAGLLACLSRDGLVSAQQDIVMEQQHVGQELTQEQIERMERQKDLQERQKERERFMKEHEGHEAMHMEMFLLLIGTLIVAQIILTVWRKYHFNSYQLVTLFGLWVFPIYFAIVKSWYFLIVAWSCYTISTLYVTSLAARKKISATTPKIVYGFFYFMIKASSIVAALGYVVAILDIVVGPYLPQPATVTLMGLGFGSMFYGLYFGVMSRDLADICAKRMATSMGYYSTSGLPKKQLTSNTCAICGEKTMDTSGKVVLDCGHSFHDFCIRGWCIVGKKQTCPYCKEKVDLSRKFPSPWERTDVMYAQLLDFLRYFVVWYPVIIYIVEAEYWTLGLE